MMMSNWGRQAIWSTLSLAAVLVSADLAYGQISFSLSSPDNLNNLTVGSTATFRVHMTGLDGKELATAAAAVSYDSTLLGAPTIYAGPMVPNPLFDENLDFILAPGPGLADVSFFTTGPDTAHHIVALPIGDPLNSVFFWFEAEVLAPGPGSLSFDFVDAAEYTGGIPDGLPTAASDPLAFVSVVPEPSSVALGLGSIAVLAWMGRKKLLAISF